MAKKPIGIYADPSMFPEFIAFPLSSDQQYQPVVFKDKTTLLGKIKENNIAGLVFGMPKFGAKNLEALMQIRKKVGELPIVVTSEGIDRTVRSNIEFVGRVCYADYNEDLKKLPELLTGLFNKTNYIEREHLRYLANNATYTFTDAKSFKATILDLSLGGAKIHFPEGGLQKKDVFTLAIPRRKGLEPLYVESSVAWTDDDKNAGLQFQQVAAKPKAA